MSVDILIGLLVSGAIIILLVTDAMKRARRKRRHRQARQAERHGHWGYT